MSAANTIDKKKKALNYFKREILSDKKKDIAKIYLYGSMAKGVNIRKESDIDLAIFAKNKVSKRLEDAIDSKAFETAVKYGESVEPLIFSYRAYKYPDSVFLKKIIKEGKKIYSA